MKYMLNLFMILWIMGVCISCQHRYHSVLSILDTDSLMNIAPDSAIKVLQTLDSLLPHLSSREHALYTLQQLNAFYRNNQELFPYTSDLDKTLDFFLKDKDDINIGKTYLLKGRLEIEKKNVVQAVHYFQNAIKYLSLKENGLFLAMAYSDLGNIYMYQRLIDESLSYHHKSRSIYQNIGDIRGAAIETNSIAYLYIFQGKRNEAINIFNEVLQQVEQMNDTLLWSSVLNNAGILHGKIGHIEKALQLLKLSVDLSLANKEEPSYLPLAEIFLKAGDRDSAYQYLMKAVSSRRLETKATAYLLLSELQKKEGNLSSAIESLENYESCMDSIHSQTKSLIVARMTYKHELELSILHEQNTHRLWLIFISLSFTIIISFTIFFFLNQNKKKKFSILWHQHQLIKQKSNIATLNNELLEVQNELLILQQSTNSENDKKEIIEKKEEELELMRNKLLELHIKLFKSTHIGQKILQIDNNAKQKEKINILKATERDEMTKNLDDIFKDIIYHLLKQVPALTREDCYFCCLSLLGLSTQAMAACFGYSDRQVIRQRKYRIKQKMEQSDSSSYWYKRLFDV